MKKIAGFGRNQGMNRFRAGDLVEVQQQQGSRQWTLCNRTTTSSRTLEECLSFGDVKDDWNRVVYKCFHKKIGLIKKVVNNRLQQPLLYEIEFPDGVYFCKAILASKYLKKITK